MSYSARRATLHGGAALLACLGSQLVPCAAQAQGERVVAATEPAASLSLDSVYRAVERGNARVRASRALVRAAEARVPGASRPPDPELQLGLMNYTLPSLTPDAALGMRQLQLMQMVPLPGKLAAASQAARARADGASARARETGWEARAQAAMAFWEGWAAEERAALAATTRRIVEDASAVATAMYRVGDGRQSDVLRARVEIARMDEEIVRMSAMSDAARARLAAVMDLPLESVAGRFAPPALPDSVPTRELVEELALDGRSMLDAGAAEVRAASADARAARRELWPDLRVGVQYGERSMDGGTDRMGSLMVGATLPLFARDRQLRMREETAAMRDMAEADLAAMRAETRARAGEVHAELVRARRLSAL